MDVVEQNNVIQNLIREADELQFRCVHCYAVKCDCNSEAGEPDGF